MFVPSSRRVCSAVLGSHSAVASFHTRASLESAKPTQPPPTPQKANTANDIRRIYAEQMRKKAQQRELFPWEIAQTKVTAWEPKYEDEKKFFYASKVQEDSKNLDGRTFRRYMSGLGSRYLLSKHVLQSGAELDQLDMTNPNQLQVTLNMGGNVLHYWFMHMQTGQRPAATVPTVLDRKNTKKAAAVLQVNLSRENTWSYLSQLHELWPRKDERDYNFHRMPRKEHGQYRFEIRRILAEGPTKPLNQATQSFIDHLECQITFHFRESKRQHRNLHMLQFLGIPSVKISKKHGGEIKVPQLRLE